MDDRRKIIRKNRFYDKGWNYEARSLEGENQMVDI